MQLGGASQDSTGFGAMEEGLISSGGRKLITNHLSETEQASAGSPLPPIQHQTPEHRKDFAHEGCMPL